MIRFRKYLQEQTMRALSRADKSKFDRALGVGYEVSKSTSKSTTIIVRAPAADRAKTRTDIETKLKRARISFVGERQGGSIGRTRVNFPRHDILITYKPTAGGGGMAETTLNASITELFPALAFMANKKFTSVDDFYKFVKTARDNGVYLSVRDKQQGQKFIEQAQSSSKYKEKMENAIAILNYLHDENGKSPIDKVYWGYREKPRGIPDSHKGDIFVQYKSGEMKGVSLKAGGAKTKEPLFNTYVNKMFDSFNDERGKAALMKDVYDKIHNKLGLPQDWNSRGNMDSSIDKIESIKEKTPDYYNEKYDEMLEMCRQAVIDRFKKNKDDTRKYIEEQIIGKADNVPLEVVKAVGTRYQYVTDEDSLGIFLPTVTAVDAEAGSSKQNFTVILKNKEDSITMNMSIRSNKPMPNNKLAQGFNLAIKFNGMGK